MHKERPNNHCIRCRDSVISNKITYVAVIQGSFGIYLALRVLY